MKLSDALVIRLSYNDLSGDIKIDENGYICLNDLAAYFPNKKINEWSKNNSTKEFIGTVDAFLNRGNSPYLKPLIAKRGKYNGGTYAHELVAMEFCTWLSPEFKLKVYLEYISGKQRKKNWNIKRILAAYNFNVMTKSIADSKEDTKPYHYSNEARLINMIVFDKSERGIRDAASEIVLDDIAMLEGKNSAFIDIEMDYQDRKVALNKIYDKHLNARFDNLDCSVTYEKEGHCDCWACQQHSIAFDVIENKNPEEWIDEMMNDGLTEKESKKWLEIFKDLGAID